MKVKGQGHSIVVYELITLGIYLIAFTDLHEQN